MNYYDVLGIRRGSSDVQIREGFRRKCLENHPDRNGGSIDSLVRMKLINEAYGVLSDVVKRRSYDLRFEYEDKRRVEEERVKRKNKIEREKKRKEEEEFVRNVIKIFDYCLKKQKEEERIVIENRNIFYIEILLYFIFFPIFIFMVDNLSNIYLYGVTDWCVWKIFIWLFYFGLIKLALWLWDAWRVKY